MAVVSSAFITVEGADFSQFYLVTGDRFVNALAPEYPEMAVGLCDGSSLGATMFTVFRQFGDIPVLVEICDAEPPPVDAKWQDVVEMPLYTMGEARLKGWDGSLEGTVIELIPQTEYRLRYAIANADAAWVDPGGWGTNPYPERYLLQVWPEPGRAPEVIVQESIAGQYWGFSHDAKRLVPEFLESKMAAEGRPLTDDEKLLAVVDGALETHPMTAQRIRGGDHLFTAGIHAFARRLIMTGYDRAAVELLILERASS